MPLPQQQIVFKQLRKIRNLRKLFLNLWFLRWLKPKLSLVISFILIGLWQLKVLLGVRRMNCKMLFLKRARLSELLILLSRLFHSITEDGKNEFLKKLCLTLNLGMLPILFLVLYAILVVGMLSKRYLGERYIVLILVFGGKNYYSVDHK